MNGWGVVTVGVNFAAVLFGLIYMIVYSSDGTPPATVGYWPVLAFFGGMWGLASQVGMIEKEDPNGREPQQERQRHRG